MILLIGIVTNNAIVLIDYVNLLRRRDGMELHEAVVEGGRRRLRPILMTTAATVLGLIPLALGIGEGAEVQASMARVVIGGMTVSTLITLLLVPVVYTTLAEWQLRRAARRTARAQARREAAEAAGLRLTGRRVDRRRQLVPDLDLVAVGVGEEEVGLAGAELALARGSCRRPRARRGGGRVDVGGSTSRKPKCATPPACPRVLASSSNTSTSRLPGVCTRRLWPAAITCPPSTIVAPTATRLPSTTCTPARRRCGGTPDRDQGPWSASRSTAERERTRRGAEPIDWPACRARSHRSAPPLPRPAGDGGAGDGDGVSAGGAVGGGAAAGGAAGAAGGGGAGRRPHPPALVLDRQRRLARPRPAHGRRAAGGDGGAVRILVAIADVDALVAQGTPIDAHARHNTTSVYTAGASSRCCPSGSRPTSPR